MEPPGFRSPAGDSGASPFSEFAIQLQQAIEAGNERQFFGQAHDTAVRAKQFGVVEACWCVGPSQIDNRKEGGGNVPE